VVNGSHEPFTRLDYLSSLGYQNLWGGRCHIIEGAGHAPFLETPEPFNRLLSSFLNDMTGYHADSTKHHPAHRVA
jgi:pimeloyl-ACP methyl ester carboxylesterase